MTNGAYQVWQQPSPDLWKMRVIELSVVTVVAAIVLAAAFGAALGGLAGGLAALAAVVLGALGALFVRNRFRAWRYQERHEDLLVARGVMFKRLSVIPYGRMQFVEVTAGPVERLFKLSTVKLHTAAAASDGRIPGLPVEEANRLRDRLAELGEANAAGM